MKFFHYCSEKKLVKVSIKLVLLILFLANACSPKHGVNGPFFSRERKPSSVSTESSCVDLILPIVDEYRTLNRDSWQLDSLVQRDLVNEEDWLEFRGSEDWQKFIARENQSDEEKEMGFTVLSLLKKRFPRVDDKRLKDRYRVLMAFCGD